MGRAVLSSLSPRVECGACCQILVLAGSVVAFFFVGLVAASHV